MQGPLTVALTLSLVVFALAALADGRALRLLRWIVRFVAERSAARNAAAASVPRGGEQGRRSAGSVTVGGAARKSSDSNKASKASTAPGHGDTRDMELTRR